MTQKEMEMVLRGHEDWLRTGSGGERAVLIDADLRGLDLRGADLRHVEAWRANFKGSRIDPAELHTLLGCEIP
jgi:uncharacterized protein YjbI with pentapeptide repeats